MALDERLRIGAGTVEVDEYGGDFSSVLIDLGKTSTDGIIVRLETPEIEVGSAQEITIQDIFDIGPQKMEMEFAVQAHKLETIALSFGLQISDVVDDTVPTPKTQSVEFGGFQDSVYYAIRFKTPQPQDNTLDDIITLYRAKLSAVYSQTFSRQDVRYIPIMVKATSDPSNSDKYGQFLSEYN